MGILRSQRSMNIGVSINSYLDIPMEAKRFKRHFGIMSMNDG